MSLVLLALACSTHPPEAHDAGHAAGHDAGAQAKHGAEHGHGEHGTAHHSFDDPEKWAEVFDAPDRDRWQEPEKVVKAMRILDGMVVADIGAGTGYFNAHLAKAVGDKGRVLALDIEPKLVEHMKARAARENTPQVEVREVKPQDPDLPRESVDRVLLVDTYHHLQDRPEYFARLSRSMKRGGVLAIVDLRKDAPFGPPAEERLEPAQITAELGGAWNLVATEELRHQYVLLYEVVK
ncbi:MAG: class I SAM-dependent methyltransferase [Alphaproteobacteria bacterium]|nr:class I SAM-dependent methyltransferase [Alphaproteobacteria bacterium]